MQVDTIKAAVTYGVATFCVVGGTLLAVASWLTVEQPGRDIALLYGVLGLVIGSALTFLFGAESSTRATRAAEKSTAAGAASASGANPPPAG